MLAASPKNWRSHSTWRSAVHFHYSVLLIRNPFSMISILFKRNSRHSGTRFAVYTGTWKINSEFSSWTSVVNLYYLASVSQNCRSSISFLLVNFRLFENIVNIQFTERGEQTFDMFLKAELATKSYMQRSFESSVRRRTDKWKQTGYKMNWNE